VLLVARQSKETSFQGPARIGLTVSRRVGSAVVRNRLKRRLREWFRTSSLRTEAGLDWVLIARPPAASLAGAALQEELEVLSSQAVARGHP